MNIEFEWDKLPDSVKARVYMESVTECFDGNAVFSDGTEQFCSPTEPDAGDTVTVRIRTGRYQVDQVYFLMKNRRQEMKAAGHDSYFDYFETSFVMPGEKVSYYFELIVERTSYYYNRIGVKGQPDANYHFELVPGFHVPGWAKGAVFYQIFVDRFCNGDTSNDVESDEYSYIGEHVSKVTDWNRYPNEMDVREFYGGDLAGVRRKLDYLQDLGVEVIYFNPLFVSPSNHKYDIQDYDYIDPHYGVIVKDGGAVLAPGDLDNSHSSKYIRRVTDRENLEAGNQLFVSFVEEVHARGMKVVLDGVFNHCGSFNKWMDRERIYEKEKEYDSGAYISADSIYRNFFKFQREEWPYNASYDGWWGHDTLPKLNYEESDLLYQYVMDIAAKWVSPPYNADGWRLDVAADLGHSLEFNHQFWRDFRKRVKEANPEAIILAEHYGDAYDWLQGDQWDTVMNYDAFMEPITWFLTGMEKHSDSRRADLEGNWGYFHSAMQHAMSRFYTQSLQVAMNQLSNHDHSRFMTRTNRKVGRTMTLGPKAAEEGIDPGLFRLGVMMQMTWPGAPAVYYGDEAGLCGWTDPDNRRTYPWGREDQELIQYHRELIGIHKAYDALKTGSLIFLQGEQDYVCYGRFDGTDRFVVLINKGPGERNTQVPVWLLGAREEERYVRLMACGPEGYDVSVEEYFQKAGILEITLPPCSGMIIKNSTIY